MDIHPPSHPIRSVREFLLEIFTVTCGIVIALALESALVAHHNRQLGEQARAEFRAELDSNRDRLNTLLAAGPADQKLLETLLQYGTARLAHQPANLPSALSAGRAFTLLPTDAWQTALATQAIAQISFDEVRALSTLNDGELVFDDFQTHAREQWIGIAAYGDPTSLNDAEVRLALQQVRIATAYHNSLMTLAHDLLAKEATAARLLGVAH